MKFVSALFFISLLLFYPGTSDAADYEVTPLFGYTFGGHLKDSDSGESFDFDDTVNYGLILSLRDESKRGDAFYEILYSHQSTYLKADQLLLPDNKHFDLDIDYLHLGGRFGPWTESTFKPYVVAGVGVAYFDAKHGDSETKFSFSIGGGVNVPLSEHIGFRLEGRAFGSVFENNSSIFCANNQCLVKTKGDVLWQYSGFSGLVFSF
jgi:opacity protein-like surface antigen